MLAHDQPQNLPKLTADLPKFSGKLKVEPEDFVVSEISAYQPSGEGEHLFLWIEKKDVSADWLMAEISRGLEVSRNDIGTAGLKDRRAVTRQFVSVPATCEEKIDQFQSQGITILSATRHTNKLKTGHLKGNDFSILARDIDQPAYERALAIQQKLITTGFPNYFGAQRMGRDGETLQTGLKLLSGEKTTRQLPGRNRRFLLRLSLSAVQSWLFNQVLAERIHDGLTQTVLEGDIMQVRETGGIFVVEDAAIEQQRFEQGETTITGPLFGPKMKTPQGIPADRESAILKRSGFDLTAFQQFKKLTPGARRPLLTRLEQLDIEQTNKGLRFNFRLPPGCYATVLLSEFLDDV